MSIKEKSGEFYMDKFNTFFDEQEAHNKKIEELKDVNSDQVIFEDAIKEVYGISEKHAKILNEDVQGKKLKEFNENAFLEPFKVEDSFAITESGFLHSSVNEVEDSLPSAEAAPEEEDLDEYDYDDEGEEEIPEDEKDEMDLADEILKDIDLGEIDNATRSALIQAIIDSAQNDESMEDEEGEELDTKEEFDTFVDEVGELLDTYQSDEVVGEDEEDEEDIEFDDEEGDEEGEEPVELEGEEEAPAEEPEEEPTEEPVE